MSTASATPAPGSDAPLLAQEAYAVGWWGGLSSRQWRIVDKDGRDALTAARARDPVRSLLWACMGIVAIFGTGGGLLLATVGNTALLVGGITMLACLAAVLLLAPVVALRRPRPVVVRDAESGTPLLEIHRRTRFALATLTYHVQLPGGERLGTLTNDPVRQTVRTVWRTALDGDAGAPITLTEPSALAALGARAVKASLISSVLASLLRAVRTALTRRPPRAALHARRADDPAPLARCVWDDSGHWLWVVFDPGAPLAHRWLILAACLLAVADENG